jgi:hypothetical protein
MDMNNKLVRIYQKFKGPNETNTYVSSVFSEEDEEKELEARSWIRKEARKSGFTIEEYVSEKIVPVIVPDYD